jgi:spore coat polysaccharide biosynthesis protein SpsF
VTNAAAIVLARMTSTRFPGKALAPLHGVPLIAHVINRARAVFDDEKIVVATSVDASDDPLHAFVESLGVRVFRGPLDDVFERFRRCAAAAEAGWAVRINGDSPMMSRGVLQAVLAAATEDIDLVTTIAPRTLPKGQNPEAVRAAALATVDPAALTADEREHVTAYFYRRAGQYRIRNIGTTRRDLAALNLSVDTAADLARLETMSDADLDRLLPETFDA